MKVLVCTEGKKCCKRGSGDVLDRLRRLVDEAGLAADIAVKRGGCFGLCGRGPVVVIKKEGLCYGRVGAGDCKEIVRSLARKSKPVRRLVIKKSG